LAPQVTGVTPTTGATGTQKRKAGQAPYILIFDSIVHGLGSCFEREFGQDFVRRRFPGTTAGAGRQTALGLLFERRRKRLRPQRTSGVGTATKRPQLGFRFSLRQELPPTGLRPLLAPRCHFQAGVRVRRSTMGRGAGPRPCLRLRRHSGANRIPSGRGPWDRNKTSLARRVHRRRGKRSNTRRNAHAPGGRSPPAPPLVAG